jgi:hypothetical protein
MAKMKKMRGSRGDGDGRILKARNAANKEKDGIIRAIFRFSV